MDFSHFKLIEKDSIATFLIGVLGLIAPGLCWVFYFFPQYVQSFDVLKLVIVSVSLFFPFFLVNWAILHGEKIKVVSSFAAGIFVTNISALFALFFTYINDYTLRQAIFTLVFTEFAVAMIAIAIIFNWRKSKKEI